MTLEEDIETLLLEIASFLLLEDDCTEVLDVLLLLDFESELRITLEEDVTLLDDDTGL